VRKENPNTLMIDAGDVFQGTPYFNFYKGEVEYKSMSLIGYDVAHWAITILITAWNALVAAYEVANSDFVSSNYDLRATPLEPRVKRYVCGPWAGVRVGLFAWELVRTILITPENFKGLKYLDPIKASREVVEILRQREHCKLVNWHVTPRYIPSRMQVRSGHAGGRRSDGVDFIASGHTHTFIKKPVLN